MSRPMRHKHSKEAVEALYQAVRIVGKAARIAEAGGGMGPSQIAVLGYLEREGPLSIAQLAERERVSHPTMSRLVSGLARSGLIAKATSPADARTRMVVVTEAGKRRRADALVVRRELVEELAGRLSPAALGELVSAAEKLAKTIGART
jgi:DNA-binding MarR family transcriptional regulator